MASPLTRRVIASMSHWSAKGKQPLLARYQQPEKAAPSGRIAELRRLLRRLADRAAERSIFIAARELNETATTKAVPVAACRVAVAIDVGVDKVRKSSRIVRNKAARPAVLGNRAGQTSQARSGG